MGIGLGSLVVNSTGEGLPMVVAATDGDHMFCVSTDPQKSVRQWRHRDALRTASGRLPSQAALRATG